MSRGGVTKPTVGGRTIWSQRFFLVARGLSQGGRGFGARPPLPPSLGPVPLRVALGLPAGVHRPLRGYGPRPVLRPRRRGVGPGRAAALALPTLSPSHPPGSAAGWRGGGDEGWAEPFSGAREPPGGGVRETSPEPCLEPASSPEIPPPPFFLKRRIERGYMRLVRQ